MPHPAIWNHEIFLICKHSHRQFYIRFYTFYESDDDTVLYEGIEILEIYRLLCQGRKTPYEICCELFNEETQNGADMTGYTTLLNKAADEIIRMFKKRAVRS